LIHIDDSRILPPYSAESVRQKESPFELCALQAHPSAVVGHQNVFADPCNSSDKILPVGELQKDWLSKSG
jgi:hypothetical protein